VKKLLALILLIGLAIYLGNYLPNNNQQKLDESSIPVVQAEEPKKLEYYTFDSDNIFIVTFEEPISIVYNEEHPIKALDQTLKDNDLNFVINGGYFKQDFSYAGLLLLNGEIKMNNAPFDKQVTHVVVLDHLKSQLSFINAKDFDQDAYQDSSFSAFQTGPLIIENNEIKTELIDNSANGLGKYTRSLLGITKSNKTFFVVTKKSYKLDDLAAKLINLDLFNEEVISVINLDGGASTSMYSKENLEFRMFSYKTIPMVLGVK
jgi:exopolysaccharide biosynthesis protein